jgi:hypothetical protein
VISNPYTGEGRVGRERGGESNGETQERATGSEVANARVEARLTVKKRFPMFE